MSTYCVTSAVLGTRDAEWARSLLSWGFSGCAGYTGTSSSSRDVHTSLVPILQRRQEPELREECSQGAFWQQQSEGSDLRLPPVPSRQPLLATPSPGQGTRALHAVLLASSRSTFSFSFCAPDILRHPTTTPQFLEPAPLACLGPLALTVSLACCPVAGSAWLLPADPVLLLLGSPP